MHCYVLLQNKRYTNMMIVQCTEKDRAGGVHIVDDPEDIYK